MERKQNRWAHCCAGRWEGGQSARVPWSQAKCPGRPHGGPPTEERDPRPSRRAHRTRTETGRFLGHQQAPVNVKGFRIHEVSTWN